MALKKESSDFKLKTSNLQLEVGEKPYCSWWHKVLVSKKNSRRTLLSELLSISWQWTISEASLPDDKDGLPESSWNQLLRCHASCDCFSLSAMMLPQLERAHWQLTKRRCSTRSSCSEGKSTWISKSAARCSSWCNWQWQEVHWLKFISEYLQYNRAWQA
jgi:hypothetical protein